MLSSRPYTVTLCSVPDHFWGLEHRIPVEKSQIPRRHLFPTDLLGCSWQERSHPKCHVRLTLGFTKKTKFSKNFFKWTELQLNEARGQRAAGGRRSSDHLGLFQERPELCSSSSADPRGWCWALYAAHPEAQGKQGTTPNTRVQITGWDPEGKYPYIAHGGKSHTHIYCICTAPGVLLWPVILIRARTALYLNKRRLLPPLLSSFPNLNLNQRGRNHSRVCDTKCCFSDWICLPQLTTLHGNQTHIIQLAKQHSDKTTVFYKIPQV